MLILPPIIAFLILRLLTGHFTAFERPLKALPKDFKGIWLVTCTTRSLIRPHDTFEAFTNPYNALQGPEEPYKALRGLIRPLKNLL